MQYKKLLVSLFVFFIGIMGIIGVSAGETSSSNEASSEYGAIQEYNFEFKALADGGKINLSWKAFPEGKDFKWYKLAYSTTKENPSYPEDTSHFIGDKREQNSGEFWSKEKMLYVRLCAVTHSNERFCSGSRKVALNQETPKTSVKTESAVMCTMEYTPVCGELNVPVMKGSSIPTKTFSNKCMMNAEKATFISMGECKTEDTETPKTKPLPEKTATKYYVGDTNKCMLIKYSCETGWAYFSDDRGCGCKKTVTSTSSELPTAIKNKLDALIGSFINKLEAKKYDSEKNVIIINEMIVKLQTLGKQEKYKKLSQYAIMLLEKARAEYENELDAFEEIFNEF